MYAVFPAKALTDNDYRPKEKIITPATVDGHNDYATFSGVSPADTINVYDVSGRKIREIVGGQGSSTWDGKDDSGRLVESGIYIYQIKLHETGKIVSGTVVVAK